MQNALPILVVLVFLCFSAVRDVAGEARLGHRDGDQRSYSRRVKRSSLSDAEMHEVTDVHNYVRTLEGASDMQMLRYSDILADLAQAWADLCQWYHGQAKPIPTDKLGYQYVGQNLYAISGSPTINLTNVTLAWYYEKPFYDYDQNKCPSDEKCGHYTQVVWADSYEIGCGHATCPFLNQSEIPGEAKFLVCNYGPSGNILEKRPFQKGQACTKCSTGQYWCTQGLCNRACSMDSGPSTSCNCSANCQNNGTLDDTTCKCSCLVGWGDYDCSKVCRNYDPRCDPPPGQSGWPPSWCNHAEYGATIRGSCLLMCKQCCSGSVKCSQISLALISTSWIIYLLLSVFNLRN